MGEKINDKRFRRLWLMSLIAAGLVIIVLSSMYWVYRQYAVKPVTNRSFMVYVDKKTSAQELYKDLESYIRPQELSRLKKLLDVKKYDPSRNPGAYKVDSTMSVYAVYKMLAAGLQTPVRFTFNNVRTIDQFAQRAGEQLMFSAEDLMALLSDSARYTALGFTKETLPSMFIPDTYEFYWTVSPERFLERMKKEYDRFWNESRRAKAEAISLSPAEVATLASIVEEETNDAEERSIVAGLYLNRIKKGILLQADPTVRFAVGDFEIRRVLLSHLQTDSPYNTYRYAGLPPGPIRIPSKQSLNAVLDYTKHDYLYMCAKEDFSGKHNFAKTLAEHNRNAARYHAALSGRNIFK